MIGEGDSLVYVLRAGKGRDLVKSLHEVIPPYFSLCALHNASWAYPCFYICLAALDVELYKV